MIEHMLAPLDGSALAECVLAHIVAFARVFNSRVTLLQVVQRGPEMAPVVDPLDWQLRRAESELYLDEVASQLRGLGLQVEKVVLEGQAAERIIDFARSADVGLIVLSSHGQGGLSEWNISSVVQKVILRSYKPTLIVRAYKPYTGELGSLHYRRVLVPLDGSRRAEYVLPLATAVARYHEGTLVLAHVITRPEVPRHVPLTPEEEELVEGIVRRNREEARRYLQGLCSQIPGQVEPHIVESSNPALGLHELIETQDIDLVMLCAHGYSGDPKWPYGSVALNIIVYGTCPLLIFQDIPEASAGVWSAQEAVRGHRGH